MRESGKRVLNRMENDVRDGIFDDLVCGVIKRCEQLFVLSVLEGAGLA